MIRLKNWLALGGPYFLLELALVAALAALLAHWTWVAVSPRSVAASTLPTHADAQVAAPPVRPQLFGATAAGTPQGAASARLRLVGLAAPDVAQGGRAIFTVDNGKARSARAGETVAPGVILHEIHRDHVVVSHNGALERHDLDRRGRR